MEKETASLCNGRQHTMEKFMEVCLLVLLYKDTSHGYGLIEHLANFGFSEEQLNVSTLYRTLRKMEQEGFVVSIWEAGNQGPRRRVYTITDNGKQELAYWVELLKGRKARIETLLSKYEELELEK